MIYLSSYHLLVKEVKNKLLHILVNIHPAMEFYIMEMEVEDLLIKSKPEKMKIGHLIFAHNYQLILLFGLG